MEVSFTIHSTNLTKINENLKYQLHSDAFVGPSCNCEQEYTEAEYIEEFWNKGVMSLWDVLGGIYQFFERKQVCPLLAKCQWTCWPGYINTTVYYQEQYMSWSELIAI